MKVAHISIITDRHTIEIGGATWDEDERSVRDRWDLPDGRFSPRCSSEIPMESLVPIMEFVAKHNELSVAQCADIIAALAASISRRSE